MIEKVTRWHCDVCGAYWVPKAHERTPEVCPTCAGKRGGKARPAVRGLGKGVFAPIPKTPKR